MSFLFVLYYIQNRCNDKTLSRVDAEIKVLIGMHNRALLQVWFQKYVPDIYHNPGNYKFNIRKSKRKDADFMSYLKACVSKLDDVVLDDESIDYANRLFEEYKDRAMLTGINWTLRCVMAPLIEAALLVDRVLFLKQSPRIKYAALVPVFDIGLSPRNMAIVAIKKDKM